MCPICDTHSFVCICPPQRGISDDDAGPLNDVTLSASGGSVHRQNSSRSPLDTLILEDIGVGGGDAQDAEGGILKRNATACGDGRKQSAAVEAAVVVVTAVTTVVAVTTLLCGVTRQWTHWTGRF